MSLAPSDESSSPASGAAQAYVTYFPLLHYIAHKKFKIDTQEAECLIHEVFVSYLVNAGEIRDVRPWLVGAISNASRNYWRRQGRDEQFQHDISGVEHRRPNNPDAGIMNRLMAQETLSRLHQKCRQTLRLHYLEGCTAKEVARELKTTGGYAEKLIHECMKKAHAIYRRLTTVKP